YPVSSAQKRIYVLQQLDRNLMHYNMPCAFVLIGSVDVRRLEQAFQQLIQRHESFRTSFVIQEGEPVQKVHPSLDFKLTVRAGTEAEARDWADQFMRPFSLEQAPLFRTELIRLNPDRHLLLMDLHHIIADGVSIDLLLQQLTTVYQGESLPELRIQYKDYAVWQQQWKETEDFQRQEAYWLSTFADEVPVLELPTDYARPPVQNFAGKHVDFVLDEELTQALKQLTAETGTTLYMLLLAAYNIWLSKYSNQTDIVVGTPVVGRSHADVQSIVGMFVNTLAMRNYPEGEKRFVDFLQEVKEGALAAYDHADYPFEELVDQLSLSRDTSRNALFQAMFTMQNFGNDLLQLEG
ncbi:HxxPF-repeated domain-containing protein, partial [Seinonella peptonophila]